MDPLTSNEIRASLTIGLVEAALAATADKPAECRAGG
jgi:hypothetical protein